MAGEEETSEVVPHYEEQGIPVIDDAEPTDAGVPHEVPREEVIDPHEPGELEV